MAKNSVTMTRLRLARLLLFGFFAGTGVACTPETTEPQPQPATLTSEPRIPTPMPWGKVIDIEASSALFMRHASGVWTVLGFAYNDSAGLGNTYPGIPVPTHSPGLDGLESISVNFYYGCGLSPTEMRCWGENEGGQLGRPYSWTGGPASVSLPSHPIAFSAGSQLTGVILEDGSLWQWGNDGLDRPEPWQATLQEGLPPMRRFFWQDQFISCAADQEERGWCWGREFADFDWSDFFLDAPDYATDIPVRVPELDDAVIAGVAASCSVYLRTDGTLVGWGMNSAFCLGTGDSEPRYELVGIDIAGPVVDFESGGYHFCALRADGAVYCWGLGFRGAMGNGSYEDQASPTRVSGLSDIIDIEAESDGMFALDASGRVWYWGIGEALPQTNVPTELDLGGLLESTNDVESTGP